VLLGELVEGRRDAAILAVLLATGIRVSELDAIRYAAATRIAVRWTWSPARARSGAKAARTVKISHEAARRLNR
jgi:site-specific recombinase XerD